MAMAVEVNRRYLQISLDHQLSTLNHQSFL
jgi:hypothetical protein